MARVKTVYNRATGKHKKKTATKMDTTKWWLEKASPYKRRVKKINKTVMSATRPKRKKKK